MMKALLATVLAAIAVGMAKSSDPAPRARR
jgi:hypothetical protein